MAALTNMRAGRSWTLGCSPLSKASRRDRTRSLVAMVAEPAGAGWPRTSSRAPAKAALPLKRTPSRLPLPRSPPASHRPSREGTGGRKGRTQWSWRGRGGAGHACGGERGRRPRLRPRPW
jgi:hypothetical protein